MSTKTDSATAKVLAALNVGTAEQEERMLERAAAAPKAARGVTPALGATERIHLHLPLDTIRALKVRAAETGLSPSQVVAKLLGVE